MGYLMRYDSTTTDATDGIYLWDPRSLIDDGIENSSFVGLQQALSMLGYEDMLMIG